MKLDKRCYLARIDNLPAANEFVEECAENFGLDPKKRFGLLLALEEAFVNICSYAYPDGIGEAELSCQGEGELFLLEIADRGKAFNVLLLPEPDITLDVTEREVGGLGIHFIRSLSDGVSYRRENGCNVLQLEFRRP